MNPLRLSLPLVAALLAVVLALSPAPARQAQQQLRRAGRHTGLVLTEPGQYQAISVNPTPLTRTLPSSVDLSGNMPPVGDQGTQDSCVAWATTYALRTYLEKTELPQWDLSSPAAQFSPAFIYNQIVQGSCGAGMHLPDALNLLSAKGAASLAQMPYSEANCLGQPSADALQVASQYRITGYRRIATQNLNDVKAHLAAKIPVVVALNVDNAFMTMGRNQIWSTAGPMVGSHAVVLVGYNDAQHAFKLINSWGTNWGTDGYGYIDYNLLPSVTPEAYIIVPFHSHEQPNQPREANVQILGATGIVGPSPGLNAQIEYTLRGYSGHTGLIVVYFWYQNGQPVGALIPGLADINGNASVATPPFAISQNDYTNSTIPQFLPTGDLNVPAGSNVLVNGQVVYQPLVTPLLMKAQLFVDNIAVATSQYFSFSVVH